MSKKLIKKFLNPAGPIEYVGMPKEEFDWMTYMFKNDPNNPQYLWFKLYAANKYGRQGNTQLPEVIVEAKRPEKTLAENAKENIEEVKQQWNNLPTDNKVDLALTAAGFIPGLDVVADVADIGREAWKGNWGNVALGVGIAAIPGLSLAGYKTYLAAKDANKARKVAKEFEHAVNEQIWRDGRNIKKYGYNTKYIITGTTVGMPEPDVNTFFHSGNFVSNLQPGMPVPQRGGYVRIKNGQIHPIDGGSGEPRIWWNKGDNYGEDEVILTTKSPKVDDQVISSPEKYKDSDIMHYSPNYYTSGAIPLDEVDIYYRNPLTGDYDHPIQHTPTTPKVEGNTYLGMLERPSKLSEMELQGVNKHNRTNTSTDYGYRKTSPKENLYYGTAIDESTFPYSDADIQEATEEIKSNMLHSNKIFYRNKNNRYEHPDRLLFGVPEDVEIFNKNLLEYVKELPDADPMFLNTNGFQSAYVQDYRKYLKNVGYDADDLSDEDLAKIITQLYKELTESMTGKTKGMVVWHSSPTMFDSFDFSNTSKYTGNMGYGGPGNYFSAARALYGGVNPVNVQPYLINNVLSTPLISIMLEKGLLPYYVSPYAGKEYQLKIQLLIEQAKNVGTDNRFYIDDISIGPAGTLQYPTGRRSEYMLRRNTGIKSLFPHPSLLTRDADGKLRIVRDWADSRINYKSGGRLIPKHATGNPVNNNPLPKRPINTNPVPEAKSKKSKGLLIRPTFKNERPVPGLLTRPRIVNINK